MHSPEGHSLFLCATKSRATAQTKRFIQHHEQHSGLSPDKAMRELFPFFLKTSNSFKFA